MAKMVKMICGNCGSERVLRDAYAEWDIASQTWILQNVFDDAVCESTECDGKETRIEEVEINIIEELKSGG
jgi:hypothetical protein